MFNLTNWESNTHQSLKDYWEVEEIKEPGFLISKKTYGFMFEVNGLDISFFSEDQANILHDTWRSALQLMPGEEIQIVFRKRLDFADWINQQLNQSFLAENPYGRRILLNQLASQMSDMGEDQPKLLSQKIVVCFWTSERDGMENLRDKYSSIRSQLEAFGLMVKLLDLKGIEKEVHSSSQDLASSEDNTFEWPNIKIEAGQLRIKNDYFRALELVKLPESFSEIGMIQSITNLPYSLDLCVRLTAKDSRPIIKKLERKRNLLHSKRSNQNSPLHNANAQIEQIDEVLSSLASKSESIYNMQLTVGLRCEEKLKALHRKSLSTIMRASNQMNFCELEEATINTFDSYLECIPGFRGKNIRSHTVLGSNAIHFLPLFRPAKGDPRAIISFQTRQSSIYSIDPVDSRLANYNWLVSGTSGSGKSFFVNSLILQSSSINPNVFIIDIGGSYNKVTEFLGGKVLSLEPGQGFELSPFFILKSTNEKEEQMRRQHIYQIFIEMIQVEEKSPSIELKHLLSESLTKLFEMDELPKCPITYLSDVIRKSESEEKHKLKMLLEPWTKGNFFGEFLDNNKTLDTDVRILSFDLKGLTEFKGLSRVVQLILCASLWAKIRNLGKERFSWIVLDEVAFSLLKTQPQFVDELVSTLRKYYAGAIIIVQDLEKVTSNFAGSSILQNTHSKAILQQRGNPRNYSEILSLNRLDEAAIKSLDRVKGQFSEIFLIKDDERTIIRHAPNPLEYWLATTAPEDSRVFNDWMKKKKGNFQDKILEFVKASEGG